MALTSEQRARIEAQIAELKKRMTIDSNDLDYETHLHTVRMLEGILTRREEKEKK